MTNPGPASEDPDDRDRLNDPKAVEAAFDEIVANIDQPDPGADIPWPDVENDLDSRPDDPPPSDPPVRTPRANWIGWDDVRPPEPEPSELDEPEHPELDDDEDEHYVPPPPPPVPRGDRVVRWAWAGAVGAPVIAIVLPLLGWQIDGLIGFLLVIAFLAGFITLISRLRPGPRVDDGPDDGAVV